MAAEVIEVVLWFLARLSAAVLVMGGCFLVATASSRSGRPR